ncbi:MAG: hypothetical protein K8T10_08540 [Candidatus Eremiobacteraeota bacterium]|nr:hypothetical protein [Candidatus Eremiobacteraeota bacterium]
MKIVWCKPAISLSICISILIIVFLLLLPDIALAGEKLPSFNAKVGNKLSLDAYLGDSLCCVMTWKVKCSSCLKSQGKKTYGVQNLNDGDFKTCWAVTNKNNGIGEWFEYHLTNYQKAGGTTSFWGFKVANGYLKSKELWLKNNRVKQMRVDINGKPKIYINLADSMNNQRISFHDAGLMVKDKDVIRLTITKIYRGTKYHDTCITEIVPMGAL